MEGPRPCEHDSDDCVCECCGGRYCDDCASPCPAHHDASLGRDPPCPRCDPAAPPLGGAESWSGCSLCLCDAIRGGGAWLCRTCGGLVPSEGAQGPSWGHSACEVDADPLRVAATALERWPALVRTRAWVLSGLGPPAPACPPGPQAAPQRPARAPPEARRRWRRARPPAGAEAPAGPPAPEALPGA